MSPSTSDPVPLHLLTVGINYAPEHTGIAPYTSGLCEYLAAGGASVQVLTGVPHYPGWTVEPRDRFRLRRTERSPGVEVRRLRHHVPARQSAVRRALYELTFAGQVAAQRPARPDVVLAVVPSLLSAVVAGRIARRTGAPLVVWVQDLMGRAAAQSGMDGGRTVAAAVGGVEARLLRRADRVLVLNERFADHARAVGVPAHRLAVHPNWTHLTTDPSDRATTRARLGWRDDETVVLHSGNMGLKQGLENVVDAARLADRRCPGATRFVLMGDGSQRAALQAGARGVAAIEFRGPEPGPGFTDVLAAADVLLVNERPSNVDMCLPSKLTSYLHAGRPIVAASPAGGGTAGEVRRSGAGLVIPPGEPDVLLDTVRGLADDPAAMDRLGVAGRAFAARHLAAASACGAIANSLREVAVAHARHVRPIPVG